MQNDVPSKDRTSAFRLMMTPVRTLLACLLVFPALLLAAAEPPPNVILIVTDNLGYGDIEPFGSTVHRTPHLTRMAREGRRFTHFCVTAGVCTPSRASIMTGCYAQRLGMHTNPRDGWVLRPVSPYGLAPAEITVAEIMKAAGYRTACIGKWHLGDQAEFLPHRQGFDLFFGLPYSDDMTARVWSKDGSTWPPLPLMENDKVVAAPANRDLLTRDLNARALRFIERSTKAKTPFFLYYPEAMPGSTSAPFASPAFKGKSKNGPWGDSIEELDWSLGRVLDKVVSLGIDQNTLIIWTSDNGAPLDRKDPSQPSRGSNAPLHGRGYTTSEGAFRVPTIMWWPGKVPAGSTCDELCSTLDLLPTFARMAGGQVEEVDGRRRVTSAEQETHVDGYDITELVRGTPKAVSPHPAYFYYQQNQLQAVRSGPWKLFLPLDTFQRHPHFKKNQEKGPLLFHLLDDVGCNTNQAAAHPELVAKLTAFADQARAEFGTAEKKGKGQRAIGRIEGEPKAVLK